MIEAVIVIRAIRLIGVVLTTKVRSTVQLKINNSGQSMLCPYLLLTLFSSLSDKF